MMMMVMMGRTVLLLPYLLRVGVCEKLLKRAGGGGRLEVGGPRGVFTQKPSAPIGP